MKVMSLFDGMSCGQIALKENGIKVETYYSSEKDKFAIGQTQLNFGNTIQLGDILNWREWKIDWSKVKLILAGSPCQGFSFAGKQLNFNDPRSKLFFVFVDILNHCKKFNPDVKFLLENVNMKKEYQHVINNMLGLFPVRINSNLVSAQNRDRLYWTNIKIKMVGLFNEIHTDIEQPKDRGVLLKDILQDESVVDRKYYISNIDKYNFENINEGGILSTNGVLKNTEKSNCIDANYYKGIDSHQQRTGICINWKAPTQRSSTGRCLDKKHNYQIIQLPRGKNKGGTHTEKCPTLTSNSFEQNNILKSEYKLRRLTPTECARLQTIPSWYKWNCSDTQQYKMLGNGWTISVIKHILKYL